MGWGSSFDDVIINNQYGKFNTQPTEYPKDIIQKLKNLKPTHDPYTNPDAYIYYECSCGAILDPGTKRFAELNNRASEAGWKIRFGETGYTPYCVKCGHDID